MFSLKKQKGFTIVELLIVIVVIGILATLVIVTFSGIQQRGRNSQRQTDINAINGHVEAYYADKGHYPTAAMINNSAWRAANMKGLDPEALKDPRATGNDIGATAATGANNQYGYVATSGGGACTETGTLPAVTVTANCDSFVLTAWQEGKPSGEELYTKRSN